jgi:hypothetical protein
MVEKAAEIQEPEKPEAPEQPAERPKSRSNIAELQRTKDREVAEAHRATREARSELAEAQAERDGFKALYTESKEKSNFTEDDEGYVRRRQEQEREYASRVETTRSTERTLTMRLLTREHGIPSEDLETYDNPKDMEIAALKWANAHSSVASEADEEDPSNPDPEEEPVKTSFDLGTGPGSTKSFKDMSDGEFAAWEKSQKAASRKNARPRR